MCDKTEKSKRPGMLVNVHCKMRIMRFFYVAESESKLKVIKFIQMIRDIQDLTIGPAEVPDDISNIFHTRNKECQRNY